MSDLELTVLSLRYSSWSMRAWLPLCHAGARFRTHTAALPIAERQGLGGPAADADPGAVARGLADELSRRRALGSVTGLFPVLRVDGEPIHEALSIAEWTAETFPEAGLWPREPLARARARSLACEMASGFSSLRKHLSCHLSAHVPAFRADGPTRAEIARVFELLQECLSRSGGPLSFGDFGIVDAMYFPVLTRFATYGVALPPALVAYARALSASPAVVALQEVARSAPALPVYDAYIRELGGDPDAWPALGGCLD